MKARLIILSVLFLNFIGLIFVFNITYIRNPSDPYLFVKKQIIASFIGIALMVVLMNTKTEIIRKLSPLLVLSTFALVLLTLFAGKGVKRWIHFPGFSIQPSEFFKISLVPFFASIVSKIKSQELDFQKVLFIFLSGTFLSVPIALQPDFGNFVFCLMIVIFILFISGAKLRHLLAIASPTVPALIALAVISPYRLKRLIVFLSPWKDPQGSGYQIIQSMISYSAGGITGKGIGDGIQKLFFLPSSHTDFIISVIAEETGLIGISLILIALTTIAVIGFTSALKTKDEFLRLLISGLTFCITFQAILNLFITVGLAPTKGLTFPFVSYGGSSVIASYFCVGMLLSTISK